jgi:hypothetical protein
MTTRSFVVGGLSAVLLVALCAGCGEKALKHPPASAFKALLEGQELAVNGRTVVIAAANVTAFDMPQVVPGPERKTATAVITFVYAAGLDRYAVDGVISYEVGPAGAVVNPRFEVNEVEPR